ncbi:GNAT family N-acetyltransferase [Shouchella lonarensis]|uniref:Acetoin utilization protein AcuA n=1 Tax=Shouchella lonarensis TaxID=1464122 RepID=A0A1G6GJ79_9BACI|nr:GNAT family N-acetyltransferase [Shouchella lonarensis]SDB81246.1 acetoin utilization protein AcuA [Shouchella lonarensis]
MNHPKKTFQESYVYPNGTLIIEGPLTEQTLASYRFHARLTSFRPAPAQKDALLKITTLPEGRVIVVRDQDTIVGYVTFVYPDPLEHWSSGNMVDLLELGGIEIAPDYRGYGLGKALLRLSMADEAMENYIVITTEYYWHWDLKGSGLDVWQYRTMMEKMMNAGGLVCFTTDDPEINSHQANCLMARIGENVPSDSIESFHRLRFSNRFMNE